jgi:hypothetical protein
MSSPEEEGRGSGESGGGYGGQESGGTESA